MAAKSLEVQEKLERVLTNWFNDRLRGNLKVAKHSVKELQYDLKDGLLLILLLENLAKPRKVGKYSKNPVTKIQCLENLCLVFKFIKSENIKLVNIGKSIQYFVFHNTRIPLYLILLYTIWVDI